jgi:hypothetical protein
MPAKKNTAKAAKAAETIVRPITPTVEEEPIMNCAQTQELSHPELLGLPLIPAPDSNGISIPLPPAPVPVPEPAVLPTAAADVPMTDVKEPERKTFSGKSIPNAVVKAAAAASNPPPVDTESESSESESEDAELLVASKLSPIKRKAVDDDDTAIVHHEEIDPKTDAAAAAAAEVTAPPKKKLKPTPAAPKKPKFTEEEKKKGDLNAKWNYFTKTVEEAMSGACTESTLTVRLPVSKLRLGEILRTKTAAQLSLQTKVDELKTKLKQKEEKIESLKKNHAAELKAAAKALADQVAAAKQAAEITQQSAANAAFYFETQKTKMLTDQMVLMQKVLNAHETGALAPVIKAPAVAATSLLAASS